jgi:hypothetical protein
MSQFAKVFNLYGAPMGRSENLNAFYGKIRCFKVKLNAGGYDDGGAYWGRTIIPLYCAQGDDCLMFIRQQNRKTAKQFFQSRASALCGNKKGDTISWAK